MKITVVDALRLKKEISEKVRRIQEYINYGSESLYGIHYQDGEEMTDNVLKFDKLLDLLETAFSYSEEINNKISDFNFNNTITHKVRRIQNFKYGISVLEKSLNFLNNKVSKSFQVIGNERKLVVSTFKPCMDKKTVKGLIKSLKTDIRELQKEIDKLNNEEIEVSFDYDDVESLRIDVSE